MMKAIQVKYLGPTTHRGSRLKAFCSDIGSITEPFDYALDMTEQGRQMAQKIIDKNNWNCVITGQGTLPNGDDVFTLGYHIES
tara:strand:+ start:645 stop:893 length:249 start_codon:yes stop_codon:yes gene_type:complete